MSTYLDRTRLVLEDEGIDALSKPLIAIGGVGGVGSVMFLSMVRMGFKRFRLAENGIFDPPDMNRQLGAYQSTMGRPKLDIYVELARDINPDVEMELYPQGISTGNLEEFLRGADAYVGIIDIEKGMDIKALTPSLLKKFNIPMFTAGAIGFGAVYIAHHPKGMMPDEFWGLLNSKSTKSGLLPSTMSDRFYSKTMERTNKAAENKKWASTAIGACQAGAFLASEIAAYFLRDTSFGGSRETIFAPKYVAIDLLKPSLTIGDATQDG